MALLEEIREILVDQLAIKPEMVKPESKLYDDLGADSLDAVELVSALEDKFGVAITDEEAKTIATVSEIMGLVEKKLHSKSDEPV